MLLLFFSYLLLFLILHVLIVRLINFVGKPAAKRRGFRFFGSRDVQSQASKIKISQQLIIIVLTIVFNLPLLLFLVIDFLVYIYIFIVFNSFAYMYFHFFNLSDTARRVRMLIDLKLDQTSYTPEVMVENRLKRLVGLKQIKQLGTGRYIIDNKLLLYVAKILNLWRGLLGY